MNRFPQHFHEAKEQPLRCHTCDNPLTENEADHYWTSHLQGQGDAYCFDCASQIEIVEFNPPRVQPPMPIISWILLVLAFAMMGGALARTPYTGWAIVGAFACINLAILSRICRF